MFINNTQFLIIKGTTERFSHYHEIKKYSIIHKDIINNMHSSSKLCKSIICKQYIIYCTKK